MAEQPAEDEALPRVRVGISACLLGAEVRFDGQHKRDAFLADTLGPHVDWVTVCPELEVGMGVPRESVRLVRGRGAGGAPRLIGVRSGEDWTARMTRFAEARVRALAGENLSGFVVKAKSPSCGMERVKVYDADRPERAPQNDGAGLFAAALSRAFPNLPIEEEGRLHDARLRESFVERLFAYARLSALWAGRWTTAGLIRFHTAHKMALLAHATEGYRALGRLVGTAKTTPRAALREAYEAAFMKTLARPTTPGRHANVLQHLLGHLGDRLDAGDRQELLDAIEAHRLGRGPLIVPLTLLGHHARRLGVRYLLDQVYLRPREEELQLRNRV